MQKQAVSATYAAVVHKYSIGMLYCRLYKVRDPESETALTSKILIYATLF